VAGQFTLAGGHGDGTANGTDGVATINGQTITGSGNSFQYSDSVGNYSFTTASGFTGTINPISVNSVGGQFTLAGGNGDGTANGTDAVATINGQTVTGSGNSFQYSDGVGTYSFSTANGFTGTLDKITANSQPGQFELAGGNGNGTANGTDAVAVINGQTITGTGNTIHVSDNNGDFQLQLVQGDQGALAPITIQSQTAAFDLTGGGAGDVAHGTDFVAVIDGVQQSNSSNVATVNTANGSYQLSFVNGFVGQFNPITSTKVAPLTISGGDQTGTAYGSDAVANINGQIQNGIGAQFTYTNNGANLSIQFLPGFLGAFDPIAISKGGQAATDNTASQVLDSTQPANDSTSSTSLDPEALSLLQQGIIQGLIQNNFGQLQNVLTEIGDLTTKAATAASQLAVNQPTSASSSDNDPQKDSKPYKASWADPTNKTHSWFGTHFSGLA
jgi:hypothetical protein